jgi:hypothetical protein
MQGEIYSVMPYGQRLWIFPPSRGARLNKAQG